MTAKEMQEQWLAKNKPKKIEEHTPSYVPKGKSGVYTEVLYVERQNLKSFNERRRDSRSVKKCKNCNGDFKPRRINFFGKVNYTKECDKCMKTTSHMKEQVKILGGWDNYWNAQEEVRELEEGFLIISKISLKDKVEIRKQIEIRERLYELTRNKMLLKGVDRLKKYLSKKEVSITGYDYDF